MSVAISERTVEIPWLMDTIRNIGPRELLDVGYAGGWYLKNILDMGISCYGLDSDVERMSGRTFQVDEDKKAEWVKIAERMTTCIADITKYPEDGQDDLAFPVVMCISTIEHIVPCGYQNNSEVDMESDIIAANNMKKLVADDGSLMLTFPCGKEHFFYNKDRKTPLDHPKFTAGNYDLMVYGKERIDRLVGNWKVADKKFWTRQSGVASSFVECDEDVALLKVPIVNIPVQSVCAIRMVAP